MQSDFIVVCTRDRALKDGMLVDASRLARELGFPGPVALSTACWEKCVAVDESASRQSVEGRLWNVLIDLRDVLRNGSRRVFEFDFSVDVFNKDGEVEPVPMKVFIGGSGKRIVFTVLLAEEVYILV